MGEGEAGEGAAPPRAGPSGRARPGRPQGTGRRGRGFRAAGAILVVLAVWLVAVPLLAVSRTPSIPALSAGEAPVTPPDGPGGDLHPLPSLTPDVATRVPAGRLDIGGPFGELIVTLASQLLGPTDGRTLLDLTFLSARDLGATVTVTAEESAYPYAYPRVDSLLDRALRAPYSPTQSALIADLGGLLTIVGATNPNAQSAGRVAFGLLRRVTGHCQAALNLGLLVAADETGDPRAATRELEAAARACPDDPTPLWYLGQSRALLLRADIERQTGAPIPAHLPEDVLEPFHRAQVAFPQSVLGWAGEADAHLTLARAVEASSPFTARHHFRRAAALYRTADILARDPRTRGGVLAGLARAESGLGYHGAASGSADRDAAVTGRRSLDEFGALGRPAELVARQVEYEERSRRWTEAATLAGELGADPAITRPTGRFLFPAHEAVIHKLSPISVGVGSLRTANVPVSPSSPGLGAPAVDDLSFIPAFRGVDGVTGHDPWCTAWSRARNLVLAGRAADGLAALAANPSPTSADGGQRCLLDNSFHALAGVTELELGRTSDAAGRAARVRLDTFPRWDISPYEAAGARDPRLAFLRDAQQDLWRFAGNLEAALTRARQWADEDPASAIAAGRVGEILFLQKKYRDAATWFDRAGTRARTDLDRAEALLKHGGALKLAGDERGAAARFRDAARVAPDPVDAGTQQELLVAYHLAAQSADLAARGDDPQRAIESYERSRVVLEAIRFQYELTGNARPEVIDNNEAIARLEAAKHERVPLAARAHVGAAVELAGRAVAVDPLSPLFVDTLSLAQLRARDRDGAQASLRTAVAGDPTLFQSHNNLGVVLAEDGDLTGAVDAFRRAIAASRAAGHDYPLGWFNLGVALQEQGKFLAGQGATAHAVRLDRSFRDRDHDITLDDATLFVALDLSKPLPADWQLARGYGRSAVALPLFVVIGMLVVRGLATVARSRVGDRVTERGLGETARRMQRRAPAAVALGLVGLLVAAPVLRGSLADRGTLLPVLAGASTITLLYLWARHRARHRAGASAGAVRDAAWVPALAVGAGCAVVGLEFLPLPVADHSGRVPWLHSAGPIALGTASAVLLPLALLTGVPFSFHMAQLAMVMTGSVLVPVRPVDGGWVATHRAAAAGGVLLLAAGLALLVI